MENVTTRKHFYNEILGSKKFPELIAQCQVPFFQINSFFEEDLLNFQDIFDIEASYNFLPFIDWKKGDIENEVIEKSLFDKGQIEVLNMLLCTDRSTNRISGERQLRLISRKDAGFFFEQLTLEKEPDQSQIEITLYNTSLGVIQSNDPNIQSGFKTSINSTFLKKIVQAKFFNGDSFYTSAEFAVLKKWIEEKGAARMENLFVNHILEHKKLKVRSYSGSPLALFFKKCRER